MLIKLVINIKSLKKPAEKMQFNYDYNPLQDGPYYFMPIIDESVYNSYVNQNILPFQNYNSSSYVNNYYHFNEWTWQPNLSQV